MNRLLLLSTLGIAAISAVVFAFRPAPISTQVDSGLALQPSQTRLSISFDGSKAHASGVQEAVHGLQGTAAGAASSRDPRGNDTASAQQISTAAAANPSHLSEAESSLPLQAEASAPNHASAPDAAAAFVRPNLPVTVPLVFRPQPAAVAANPQMAAAVQSLQQDFVNSIGGENQDPNDPTYAQRWTAAQKNIDEQLRLKIGDQAFLLYEIQGNGGSIQ